MDIPNGYKQTEIGVIPSDWEIIPLEQLTILISDGIHATPQYVPNSEFYFINGNNLIDNTIKIFHETKCVSKEEYDKYKKHLNEQTILMSINGTIGNLAFYNNQKVVLGKSACYINLDSRTCRNYIFFQLQTEAIKRFYENELTGTTIKNLSLKSVRNTPIPIPPTKAEQTAIAAALNDADALITAVETLLAKKRHIKHGAMQALLQPQAGWVVKKLGEIGEIDHDNLGADTDANYTFHYISLEDVDCGILRNTTELVFCEAPSRARRKIKKGDILIATVRPNLKSHLLIKEDVSNWICSTGFSVLRCSDKIVHCEYVFHHLFASIINNQIETLISGSNYPAINSKDVRSLQIPVPPLEEQTRIAHILSDMDAELAALEQQLTKYRQIKQGMMQNLLTGKIRLTSIPAPQGHNMSAGCSPAKQDAHPIIALKGRH